MSDNKAMKLLLFFIGIVIFGIIVDAFRDTILQLTNTALQSANENGFQYLDGLLIVIPIGIALIVLFELYKKL